MSLLNREAKLCRPESGAERVRASKRNVPHTAIAPAVVPGEIRGQAPSADDAVQPATEPAKRLIGLSHQRGEEELTCDELKTPQRARPVLHSAMAGGVVQRVYALLLTHDVIRERMCATAESAGLAPRALSFVSTLEILRCRPAEAPLSGAGLKRWYDALSANAAEEALFSCRDQVHPRVIRTTMSRWSKPSEGTSHNPAADPTLS